jgi:hypothetical protein
VNTVQEITDPGMAGRSAASWPAIIAGAFVAAAVSLTLLALGSGLGFASISPWPNRGISAMTFTITAAIWLIVMQWVSAGLGGYIAGRLRTRWIGTHTHEVFFRDTAHGLVTWAVATVFMAAVLATSVASLIGGAAHTAADAAAGAGAMAGGAMAGGPMGGPMGGAEPGGAMRGGPMSGTGAYGVDKLLRSAGAAQGAPGSGDPRAEVGHIVANAMLTGDLPEEDRTYLAELVAARAGISQAEAQKRVDDFIAGAKEAQTKVKAAADAARKAALQASIYMALSLLVGAFIASVSAALGGRLRDEHP